MKQLFFLFLLLLGFYFGTAPLWVSNQTAQNTDDSALFQPSLAAFSLPIVTESTRQDIFQKTTRDTVFVQNTPPKDVWEVLIVAITNDEDKKLSNGAQLFVEHAKKELAFLQKELGFELVLHVVTGDDVTPEKISAQRNRILAKAKPQGGGKHVFLMLSFSHGTNFVVSGTGIPYLIAHPSKSTITALDTPRYVFSIERFYDNLRTQRIADKSLLYDHVLIFSELCNRASHFVTIAPDKDLSQMDFKGSDAANNIRDFFYSEKSLLIVSSSYGQASCVDESGGVFSRALFETIHSLASGKTSPEFDTSGGFWEWLRMKTKTYAKEANCNQEPMFYRNSQKVD